MLDSDEANPLTGTRAALSTWLTGKGALRAGTSLPFAFPQPVPPVWTVRSPLLTIDRAAGEQSGQDGYRRVCGKGNRLRETGLLPHLFCLPGKRGAKTGGRISLDLRHVRMSDASLGVLLDVMSLFGLFGEYHILLTGEMGGHSRESTEKSPGETAIPWLACGPRIVRGMSVGAPLSLIDTAPTVAELMHLPPMSVWQGKPVQEVLVDPGGGAMRGTSHEGDMPGGPRRLPALNRSPPRGLETLPFPLLISSPCAWTSATGEDILCRFHLAAIADEIIDPPAHEVTHRRGR